MKYYIDLNFPLVNIRRFVEHFNFGYTLIYLLLQDIPVIPRDFFFLVFG